MATVRNFESGPASIERTGRDAHGLLLPHYGRLLAFAQNWRPIMRHSPYLMNGCPKACAGCGQPFPIREGRVEAQVGHDTQLYCYGTTCQDDALEAASTRKRRAS